MASEEVNNHFLNYTLFKKIADQRRWMVKVYVCFESGEWESCGKGILKFYQFINKEKLEEIHKRSEVDTSLDNLFILVEDNEDTQNEAAELRNSQKYGSILKFRNTQNDGTICFYNMSNAYNLELEAQSKLKR